MKKLIFLISTSVILTACSNSDKTTETSVENKSLSTEKYAKTSIKGNNIYAVNENGTEKQLTFNGTDTDPILIKNEGVVIFVRNEGKGDAMRKKIMKVNLQDLSETTLTDQKPYEDGLEGSHDIFNVYSPILSLDGKSILFVTEKWATGNQLVKVDINTGKWVELFPAETFEQLDMEPYHGYFLAGQSAIESGKGRDIYYRLLNDSGRIIKKFSDEESMKQFRAGLK